MRKKLTKRKEYPEIIENLIGITISSIIGIAITFLLSVLLSFIINKSQYLPQNLTWYLMGAVVIGAFSNGFISTFRCKLKGIFSGLVSAILFSLFITVALLIFSNGQIETKTGLLYVFIFVFSALGGVLGANTKRRK